MLEKIILRNFQCHERLEIEFDPHITSIIGRTDVGKSAVCRALRSVLLNKLPRGKVSRGAEEARVSITLYLDNRRVRRRRGPDGNTYELDDKLFTAIGMGKVPKEVEEFLNVTETNFQRQIDLPFWFTESPGQVSKNLNEIINLGDIDDALANIASELRKARSEEQVSEDRLTEARKKRDELSWVPEFYEEALELKTLEMDLVKIDSEIVEIKNHLEYVRIAREKAERPVPKLGKLTELRAEGDKVAEECRYLEQLLEDTKEARERLEKAELELQEAEQELKEKAPTLCPACGQPLTTSSESSVVTFTSRKLRQ